MRNPRADGGGPAAAGARSTLGSEGFALSGADPSAQPSSPVVPRATIAAAKITSAIWTMIAQGRSAAAITTRAHDLNRTLGLPFDPSDVDGEIEHILATISDNAGASP